VKNANRLISIATVSAVLTSFSGTASASSVEVKPGDSGDDTARLQAALSRCAESRMGCDIHLAPGVFYTDVLLVKGFTGSFTGSGEGKTIIRPLASRPLRSTATPFVDEPTLAEPYPALLHFANDSKVVISRLTLDFPASMTVMPHEDDGPGNTDSLVAAILVDGAHDAELRLTQVTITGVDKPNFNGSNLSSAVRFEGQQRSGADGETLTRRLKHGKFIAKYNHVEHAGFALSTKDADDVEGVTADNYVIARIYGISYQDVDGSKLSAVHNVVHADLEGVFVGQFTTSNAPRKPSSYVIMQNKTIVNESNGAIEVDPETQGYGGIEVFDFATLLLDPPVGETITSEVTIFDNEVIIGAFPVQGGINVTGQKIKGNIRVIGNRVHGNPYDANIRVDYSRGTYVAANDLRDTSPTIADVHLMENARDCIVIEPGDTVRNQGKNNHVIGSSVDPLTAGNRMSSLATARGHSSHRRKQ
jgi:hypothetical protein